MKGMDLFEAIIERRSIRKFTDEPVYWGDVVKIIEAGMHAPSSGNLQNWKFVIITEEEKKKQIAEACAQQHWISKAPVIIVVCSDMERIRKFYGIRGERLYAIQNCAAAIQNMLLAAHALGLASCWVGAFEENAIQRIIDNPDHVRIEAILPIGHPAEKPEMHSINTLESTCFFERWGNRIKDMPGVLWDYNVAGNLLKKGRKGAEAISKCGKELLEKLSKTISSKKRK
ncbi:MAG: nitroreductase family protein [Candidatus Woesearchaeota archaeon]